jgi:hypothetical protein
MTACQSTPGLNETAASANVTLLSVSQIAVALVSAARRACGGNTRPAANLTGVLLDAPTLCSKWLQYIDDVVPNVTKVGVLWDVTTGTFQLDAVRVAASSKSLNFIVMQFRNVSEISGPSFSSARRL